MRLSHFIISVLPLAFTASGLPVSTHPSLPGDYNRHQEKDTKMRKLEWVHKGPDHPVTEPSLPRPISRFSGVAKSDSHDHRQIDATQEGLGQDAISQEDTPQEQVPEEETLEGNTLQKDASPEIQNSAFSPQIVRRGSGDVDRRQQDQDAPIDFSLMSPCMEKCFWKNKGHAPGDLAKVSIREWCEDKAARWRWWLDFGPLQCVVGCKKEDPDTAKISRDWFKSNCGY